ncbi:MAG: hypothetical protein ABW046_03050 [Actinoplanes sp.]
MSKNESATDNAVIYVQPERRRRFRVLALGLGLAASAAVVLTSSHAAFTANTSNDANVVGAGSVYLADNDGTNGATAMFNTALTPLVAGATNTACMGVQYTGSLAPSAIKMYFTGAMESNNGAAYANWANTAASAATSELDDNLTMHIEVSTDDQTADPVASCTPTTGGFVDVTAASPSTPTMRTLIGARTDFSSGLPSQWGTIVPNKWRIFKFTYTLDAAAPNSAQADALKFNVVWESKQ